MDDKILYLGKYKVEKRRYDEVFIQVDDDFNNYYISNDGRLAHIKSDKTIKILTETKYSNGKVHNKLCGYIDGEYVEMDFRADYLVAKQFLVPRPGKGHGISHRWKS